MRPTEEDFIDFCARRGIDEDDAAWVLFEDWIAGGESMWDTREEQAGLK